MDKAIEVYMKNQKGSSEYNAKAKYYGDRIIVLKGSKINKKVASSNTFQLNAIAKKIREEVNVIDDNSVLLKDIEFKSASTAAQFVCGYSVNGLASWRTKEGESLKNTVKGWKQWKN